MKRACAQGKLRMRVLLEIRNLHFSHGPGCPELLRGVSARLCPGDRLGLCGDIGSGKSSLLHLITGLLKPSSGSVHFEGRALETEKDFRAARLGMGYLLQRTEDQLFCPTVLEDAAFGPINQGLSPAQARERALESLRALGVERLAERTGCNLSGGEQKLAALASVLSMRPKLLLLDEPTNDLDPASAELLRDILLNLGLPFIAVSHDAAFLQRVCTGVLRLRDGILVPVEEKP